MASPAANDQLDLTAMKPVMEQLFSGYLLRTALHLRLPDRIGDEPVAVAELAAGAEVDPSLLRRTLRALASIGVFEDAGDDRFGHTTTSAMLTTSGGTGSFLTSFLTGTWLHDLWENLPTTLHTGRSPFFELHGKDFYDYLSEDAPELSATFNDMMTAGLGNVNPQVVGALRLGAGWTIVDVGGGQGTLLRDVLHANENIHGVLFDIPSALAGVTPELRTGKLAARAEIVAGDARESVPSADAYLFRTVLHNWDDESCVRMLSACARSGAPGARVFIVDIVVDVAGADSMQTMMDLHMFMLFGSKERTEAEFAQLVRRAGLRYERSTPIESTPFNVTVARIPETPGNAPRTADRPE